MAAEVTYRGIEIVQLDTPGAAFNWVDWDAEIHSHAPTLDEAKRQIGRYLGPQGGAEGCPECGGTGYEDWSAWAISPCEYCLPEEGR